MRCLKLAMFLALATVSALPAQLIQPRGNFTALRDSLAALPDSAAPALERRAQVLLDQANQITPDKAADVLIERGVYLLRLSEVSESSDFAKEALKTFQRAVELAPRDVWARYGLAVAYLAQPEVRIKVLGGVFSRLSIAQVAAEVVKEDPRSKAMRELQRALELNPSFEPAIVTYAEQALESRQDDELRRARDWLRPIFATSRDHRLATLAADVAVALGDLEFAEQAAGLAGSLTADSSIAAHVLAGVLLRISGQLERGAAAYQSGIDRLSVAGAERYYADVLMLATDLERAQWLDAIDKRDIEHRRAWIRNFWNMRAARSATRVEDRIAEHYERLDIARSKYRRSQKRGAPQPSSVLQEGETERLPYDDRGNVHVRYGKPDQVIRTNASGLHPNETWVYNAIDGERRFFHFVASRGSYDFTVVDNVFAAAEDLAPTESVIALLEDRAKLNARFSLFAERLRGLQLDARRNKMQGIERADSVIEEMRSAYPRTEAITSIRHESEILAGTHRKEVLASLRRDAAMDPFDRPLPFYYDIYTFKGAAGKTDLTAAVAIPGNMMEGREMDGRLIYSVDVSVIIIDTLDARVERRDTTVRFWSSRKLQPQENIRFHVNFPATPSSSTIHRIVVRNSYDPQAGAMYGGRQEVTEFQGRELMISEIVLADSATTGAWQRDSVQLSLLPPRQIKADGLFSLFYEIYNLPTGDRYHTQLQIEPVDGSKILRGALKLLGGGKRDITLSFEETANSNLAATDQELRRVRADLSPGRYRIRVTVTNQRTMERATREKLFLVTAPGKAKR